MLLDIENWKEIGATLARNKTRTFLTAFGIFWGTFMLAILWGGAQGMKGMLYSNFDGFASNSAIIFPQRTTMPYKGYRKGMNWSLTITDVKNLRNVAGIENVSAQCAMSTTQAKYGSRSFSTQIQGLEPSFMDVLNPIILSGRFINDNDIANDSKVCLIGKNVANALFGDEDPIGKFVEADNIFFRVIGTIQQRSEITFNGRLEDTMIIPLSTAMRIYNMGNKVHFMAIVAQKDHKPAELKPTIFRVLRSNHPLHPNDENALFFMDTSEMFEMVDNVFTGVDVLILFVGLSSLIAGIIGVGNIMWIIVKERTKEFGIRRALGAKPRTVMWQILSESAVLTVIAGTAGICFAALVLGIASDVVTQISDAPAHFQLTFRGAILILITFLILGSAAGTIPAIKAMKIKPIEALNDK